MDIFRITGPVTLKGTVQVNGSKNAALPILAACILTGEKITLRNLPDIRDVRTIKDFNRTGEVPVAARFINRYSDLMLHFQRESDRGRNDTVIFSAISGKKTKFFAEKKGLRVL